jgi:beta-lactam-binding protein with PASTA domain
VARRLLQLARMKHLLWIAALGVAGCQVATSGLKIGSPTSSDPTSPTGGGGESKVVTIPDLTGMSKDDAVAAIRKAGVTRDLDVNEGPCADESMAHGHVCLQSPGGGQQQMNDLMVSVTLQSMSPDSSTPGVPGAHYKMPDVVGMTSADARKKLAAAGFSAADNVEVIPDEECPRGGIICSTDPDPGKDTTTEYNKALYVGASVGGDAYNLFDK